jgi:hypothetical protein
MFAPPSARRNVFKCAPPNFKSWIRPWLIQYSARIDPGIQSCRGHVSEIKYALLLHIKKNNVIWHHGKKTFKNVFRIHKFQIVQSKRRFYRM